jgi:CheY-like chemotaxis protein/MinD-like ATPase involved in chromosome partitioning or flagellar assembly
MPRTILVVDDDPNALRVMTLALRAEGYRAVTAASGQDGLTQARDLRPDLVLLDVMMADLDGYEVCRRLRADPSTQSIPVIMLTAKTLVVDKISGIRAGADEYIPKPAEPSHVIERIDALLNRLTGQSRPPGRVIGCLGAKGGVGTTTVVVNVAALLAHNITPTILIDLRPTFGCVGRLLGLNPRTTLFDLLDYDPFYINSEILQRTLAIHASGLRVLPGTREPRQGADLTPALLRSIVAAAQGLADWIFLDIPPLPGSLSLQALNHCDFVVLIIEPEPLSVALGEATLSLLTVLGVRHGSVAAVVVKRDDQSLPLPEVGAQLRARLLGTVPPDAAACLRAADAGVPVCLMHPNRPISLALKTIAERLVNGDVLAEQVWPPLT